jgi:tRNA pseudouridine55 synthase
MSESGFLLIDKAKGWTSFDVVAKLRRITGIRKIGHTGTLDPMATGLLIVAVGRGATKRINEFMKQDKKYIAEVTLGANTDTYDAEGEVIPVSDHQPTLDDIQNALTHFIGEIDQVPPMYSAKKVGGKKLYELAREGKTIERKPSRVHIYEIEVLEYAYPTLKLEVHCGSGTYIRSLAYDLGVVLKTGAFLSGLRRISISSHLVEDAITIEKCQELGADLELLGLV